MFINGDFKTSDSLYQTYLVKGCFTLDNWSLFLHRYVDCVLCSVHLQMAGEGSPIQTIAVITTKLTGREEKLDIEDALDFMTLHPTLTNYKQIENVLEYTNVILNLLNVEGKQFITIPMSNERRVKQYVLENKSLLTDEELDFNDTAIIDDEGYFIEKV